MKLTTSLSFRLKKSLCLSALLIATGCAAPVPIAPHWEPMALTDLPGWKQDKIEEVLPAFNQVCTHALKKDAHSFFGTGKSKEKSGTVLQWDNICASITDYSQRQTPPERRELQEFFSHKLQAWAYSPKETQAGLFTGYYEPELLGSWTKDAFFTTPLWSTPHDLITVDIGDFLPDLKGRKIVGKIEDGKLKPYDTRADITTGSLTSTLENGKTRATPLVFVNDPVAAFFLEIQGSGRILLQDGSTLRVGYAAQNGHGYAAIGKVMLDQGLIEKPVTMPKIKKWLENHPDQAASMMNSNPSVIFFKKRGETEPLGAMGLPLFAERSLAVDPTHIPLGIPLWISVGAPASPRMVVAMDTGGAIKGPMRGDLFWGRGAQAEEAAGVMQSTGSLYLILPKDFSPNL